MSDRFKGDVPPQQHEQGSTMSLDEAVRFYGDELAWDIKSSQYVTTKEQLGPYIDEWIQNLTSNPPNDNKEKTAELIRKMRAAQETIYQNWDRLKQ